MPFHAVKARTYVRAVDLSGTPRGISNYGSGRTSLGKFSTARNRPKSWGLCILLPNRALPPKYVRRSRTRLSRLNLVPTRKWPPRPIQWGG